MTGASLLAVHAPDTIDRMSTLAVLGRPFWSPPSLFSEISDAFYRENYHSDILAHLLRRSSESREAFVLLLRRQLGPSIRPTDFKECDVIREVGRVDIALTSRTTNQAILVENKSNRAADRDRQLPTYLRYYEHRGYQVPAIAYVNQRSLKPPDQISWRAADVDTIHGKLCVLRMVGGPHSLALDWLKPLARNAKEEDIRVIAKQFLLLMNKIVYGGIEMDQMSEFHNYMSKKDGYAKLAKILSIMEPYSVFLSSELGKELHDSCTKPFGAPYLGDNDGSVVIDL